MTPETLSNIKYYKHKDILDLLKRVMPKESANKLQHFSKGWNSCRAQMQFNLEAEGFKM